MDTGYTICLLWHSRSRSGSLSIDRLDFILKIALHFDHKTTLVWRQLPTLLSSHPPLTSYQGTHITPSMLSPFNHLPPDSDEQDLDSVYNWQASCKYRKCHNVDDEADSAL